MRTSSGAAAVVAAITESPEPADDPGVEGNARLTAATGAVLLILLAVEGVTILDVRGLITLHVFLGVVLVGPVLLKIGTTAYRFARYYRGAPAYVRRGAPPLPLRVLGPFVVATSVAVLATGVALLAVAPGDGPLLAAHKVSFIVWFGVMTVHVLGHLREDLVVSGRELRASSPRRRLRVGVVLLALVVGVGLAAALLPAADPWLHRAPAAGTGDR